MPITVRDLSRHGTMLSGDDLPSAGTAAVVVLETARLSGVVAWSQDGYCGISLQAPIDPLQVVRDVTRGRANGASAQPKGMYSG